MTQGRESLPCTGVSGSRGITSYTSSSWKSHCSLLSVIATKKVAASLMLILNVDFKTQDKLNSG